MVKLVRFFAAVNTKRLIVSGRYKFTIPVLLGKSTLEYEVPSTFTVFKEVHPDTSKVPLKPLQFCKSNTSSIGLFSFKLRVTN